MAKYHKRYYKRNTNAEDEIFVALAFVSICIFINYWQYILAIVIILVLFKLILFINDCDLFSTFKESKLYYQGNSGQKYLNQLKQEQQEGKNNQYNINCLKKGLSGEHKVLYTLMHMEYPMYIMHDIKLQYKNHKAQIDLIVVTKKATYMLEVKDLNGNIDIEGDGTITRVLGKYKQGIKNPLTQNNDHIKVIKSIFKKEKIYGPIKSLLIFANDSNYIHFKKGTNGYKNKIFRNDKLEENLIKIEKKKHIIRQEKKMKSICDSILKYQIDNTEMIENSTFQSQ